MLFRSNDTATTEIYTQAYTLSLLDALPIPCASHTRYEPCDDCDVATCQVRRMMLNVRNAIAEVLDNTTLAQMRDADGEILPLELRETA